MSSKRYPHLTPEAHIVVSTQGYFDVFAAADHPAHERPAYRGEIAELGRAVTAGEKLTVSPRSAAMAEALTAWSARHGADAVAGRMGKGRQETEAIVPVKKG
jgi:hypothetical protein